MEIMNLDCEEVKKIGGGKFGDWSISCCSVNMGGLELSFEMFMYSGGYNSNAAQYGFDRMSAYNRL